MRRISRKLRFSLRGIVVFTALVAVVAALLAPVARDYLAPGDPQLAFDALGDLIETTVVPSTSGGEDLGLAIDP